MAKAVTAPVRDAMKVEMWPIARLNARATNSRTHTPQQIDQIVASIREFGWTNPILAGSEDDVIAGHARLMAAQKMWLTEVPVIVLGHLTEDQKRALVIADNQLALNAGWDNAILAAELELLKAVDFNLELLGFNESALVELLAGGVTPDGDGENTSPEAAKKSLAERFGVPPFSVLDARQGYWQDRKRAWLSLGIKSELGRGDAPIAGGSDAAGSGEERGGRKANATPGGSLMPACDYSKKQRGDGAGRAIS